MVSQGKNGGHRHIPPSGVIRDSGPHFDQALDQPINGPPHFLSPDVELPDHVEEVVSQKPNLQPGLVGLEALATGLIPPQGVLSFLEPVFYLPPAVIDLGHLAGRQPETGDHKPDTGEQLAPVPLDLGRNPAGSEGAILMQRCCV